ncbi:MAG TPA: transcriptional regulator, partial [Bacteroidia bacterium]|nr:transcriptional regulator [Bacteroidia bacterium]
MTRFDRITAILVQLQSKKIVTAQEIADRFEISLRTVYRDIRSLEEAGVPIVSEAGVGYSMMEGYRLPPIVFSKEEALSFITAEKLMDRFSDYSINKDYQSALFKVKAVLRSSEKESIARVDGSISVLPNSFIPDVNSTPLGKIMAGIESGTALSIKYLANYTLELSTRIVEPIGVFHQGQHWHMIAYCRLRKDYRDFRLDRIQHIENREDRIEGKHPALQTFLNQVCKNQQLTEVIIEVQRDKYRHIGDQKYYNGFISQEVLKDVVKITFLAESLE